MNGIGGGRRLAESRTDVMKLPQTERARAVLAIVAAVQVASSALAWRDLASRTDDQVRGPKNLWRVIVTVNPGNSIAYWLFGRRQAP
jgi:hypothetical protein